MNFQKKSKFSNPLFLLDEVDKIGSDWRGDPASALLEVLDPEQNKNFNDHYLEVDYDLSNVMFLTTANTLNIPQPLIDRMEVIRLAGYTEDEKKHIAHEHLIAKCLRENGLVQKELHFSKDAVVNMIREYTREAGVRELERHLSKICRKVVKEKHVAKRKSEKTKTIVPKDLQKYLESPPFDVLDVNKKPRVGVVNGLAWTQNALALKSRTRRFVRRRGG